MSCRHTSQSPCTAASCLAETIDRVHGPEPIAGPFFYMVHPGNVLVEVAIDEPYDFLDVVEVLPVALAIGLVVEGWAAPVGGPHDGIQPSRHPERFRARTTMFVDAHSEASVLRYGDEPPRTIDEPIGGDLADALRWCWQRWRPSDAART